MVRTKYIRVEETILGLTSDTGIDAGMEPNQKTLVAIIVSDLSLHPMTYVGDTPTVSAPLHSNVRFLCRISRSRSEKKSRVIVLVLRIDQSLIVAYHSRHALRTRLQISHAEVK